MEAPMHARTLLWLLVLSVTPGLARTEDGPESPISPARMTDAQKEHFLLEGRIERTKEATGGTTGSLRVTMSLDGFEHDAQVQTVDVEKSVMQLRTGPEFDFRDSYKNNIAAYRLDRLLGLGMVPVTVLRHYNVKPAAYTWWLDDVLMSLEDQAAKKASPPDPDRWNCQIDAMRTFDQLIYNTDRNAGNLVIDKSWWVWMIDHTRSFKVFKDLNEKSLGKHCARSFLAGMRRLDEPTLRSSMEGVLNPGQIKGLLGRRDKIVAHFEKMIAKQGEGAVLCDLPTPAGSAPAP
jgi:hypothetical protein